MNQPNPTLFALFASRRAEFEERLHRLDTTPEAGKAIDRLLAELRDEAARPLTVDAARTLHALIHALSSGAGAMAAPTRARVSSAATGGMGVSSWPQIALTALQIGVCVVILFAPLEMSKIVWFLVLAIGVLLGVELLVMLARFFAGRRQMRLLASAFGVNAASSGAGSALVDAKPDAKHVCDRLSDALGAIDQVIASRSTPAPAPISTGLAGYRDLLEWLQRLLGAAGASDAQESLSLSRQVRQLLLRHNIHVRDLDTAGGREPSELFDAEPDITGRLIAPVTQMPALLEGDRVLLRGRTVQPQEGRRP